MSNVGKHFFQRLIAQFHFSTSPHVLYYIYLYIILYKHQSIHFWGLLISTHRMKQALRKDPYGGEDLPLQVFTSAQYLRASL